MGPLRGAGARGRGGERWARVGRGGRGGTGLCPAAACCGDRAGSAPVALVPWPQGCTELRGEQGGAQASRQPWIGTPGWTTAFAFCVLFAEAGPTYEGKTVKLHAVTPLINRSRKSTVALYLGNILKHNELLGSSRAVSLPC